MDCPCPYLLSVRCTLTGRECLCLDDQTNCTRRAFAISYEQKHVKVPSNIPPVILTDSTGRVTDIL
jgi:hypothetical protein